MTATTGVLAGRMQALAAALLAAMDDRQRQRAAFAFTDEPARRWLEYRPEPRPGACLAELGPAARKAAIRLLASGLSEHAFAQAAVITALEDVLDESERGRLARRSDGYFVSVFGLPGRAGEPWSWRFEGHHLSVTMTMAGDAVSPAPVFLGANPAVVSYRGRPVSRPLGPEEDLARELLDAIGPAGRATAIVAERAPADIHSATAASCRALEPLGIGSGALTPAARALLRQLASLYLDRLPPELAEREEARLGSGELHFAWEGPADPRSRHYYRVQGDDLLIEYDTTSDGNHAHSVLRRPRSDFGDDVLAAHHRASGGSEGHADQEVPGRVSPG
jgi:hypothetical protein